jgi:hypothetical protein
MICYEEIWKKYMETLDILWRTSIVGVFEYIKKIRL